MQVYYEPDMLHAKQWASDSNLSYIHSMVYTLPLTYTVNMPFKVSQQIFSSAFLLMSTWLCSFTIHSHDRNFQNICF